jgi:hypothetical protein
MQAWRAEERAVTGAVSRRRVFYIPGFDPLPPRRYRELYRSEGAAQAALSGYRLDQCPGSDAASWRVTAEFGGTTVEAAVTVLVWSDLVRAAMAGGLFGGLFRPLRTIRTYLARGTLWRLMRLRRGPMLAALYPLALLAALLSAMVSAAVAAQAILAATAPAPVSLLGGAAAALAVWSGGRRLDRRLYAGYLWHDFAFASQANGAYPAALEARIGTFRRTVDTALSQDWDEVLVVGHSLGAQIAVSVVADLLRGPPRPARPALALLTLGQVIPMQSFLPAADRLRADLRDLSDAAGLTWVDVSAPGDGCCFALCDPVAVSGVAPERRRWPLVISAAFARTLRPETLAALRWRFFRLHFQYLCAFDSLPGRTGDYDYFRITAGPMTLAARFAGRAPSAARIERALSRHRGTAA